MQENWGLDSSKRDEKLFKVTIFLKQLCFKYEPSNSLGNMFASSINSFAVFQKLISSGCVIKGLSNQKKKN